MILHGYWRSGAAYRARIALNLKGLSYDQQGVDLRTGAHRSDAFVTLNPQGMVPALEVDGAVHLQRRNHALRVERDEGVGPVSAGAQVHALLIIAQALEIQGDTGAIRRARAPVAVQDHRGLRVKARGWRPPIEASTRSPG